LQSYINRCLKHNEEIDPLYESLTVEQLTDISMKNPQMQLKISKAKRHALQTFRKHLH